MFKVIGCKFLRPRNLCSPPHQKPLIYERFFYVQGHRLQVPMISELVFTTTFKSLPFREVFYSHCHRLQVPTTSELVFTTTFKSLLFREAFLFTLSSVTSSYDLGTCVHLHIQNPPFSRGFFIHIVIGCKFLRFRNDYIFDCKI